MENENTLTIVDEKGNETLCQILFTYHSDKFNKNYVLFLVPGEDDEEEQEVGAASYIEKDGGIGELEPIESDEEWDEVGSMLSEFVDEDECECGCNCEECEGECHCDGECHCHDK